VKQDDAWIRGLRAMGGYRAACWCRRLERRIDAVGAEGRTFCAISPISTDHVVDADRFQRGTRARARVVREYSRATVLREHRRGHNDR